MREAETQFRVGKRHDSGTAEPWSSGSITAATLMDMTMAELEALYGAGRAPESVRALDGSPRGLVPAVAGLDREPIAGLLSRVSSSRHFPWRGKRFESLSDERGEGTNRLRGLGDALSFSTSIEASAVDGAPCVVLDYDRPENPWPIRKLRDELREVGPGLFLGPALLTVRGRKIAILYFALDFEDSQPA